MKKLLIIPEAAELLRCSTKTVRRLLENGQLQGLKVRGGVRVVARSLDDYIHRQIENYQFENGGRDF